MTRAEAEANWTKLQEYVARKCAEHSIPYSKPELFRFKVYMFEELSGEAVPLHSSSTTREQWLRYWTNKFRQYRKIDQELEALLIEYIQELRHG